ncbi:ADP-glyceromanno-heptose 6-epimerase [Candidatus Methylospira mobilis]|uniref:ADP-glyceromanno-heptose 6-epimerase n=1 Tax=Candidatus Methylospira mobilis TaxID=1808979 RepID=UPI0028EAB5D0|nr:ADP-glyceromanno-heptose 6-epimerase [Candidatus Methylospira mobilis]WNV06686.1 ADP-glyceromanno-heptose 6-epimerase [Candidatus Methylospira mobilis]
MIVITGGGGMIGSMVAWRLNVLGRDDLVIVDSMTHPEQWQNLCHRRYANYFDKNELPSWLEHAAGQVNAIVHMGAISATTEQDWGRLLDHNIRHSQFLWSWCADRGVPFFYASSAATYGSGDQGYDDASIENLRPLNAYGYSKHFFDQWVMRQVEAGYAPPQWAGFKFFNVYGPNEYHKQRMASVAFHSFNQFRDNGTVKLFRSRREGIADGMQSRDFIHVKDAAAVLCWFIEHERVSGIYNIGTGQARSFLDLATAVMTGTGREPHITWIDMPEDLEGKYQYFTEARIDRLRAAGYTDPFLPLEDGVRDYVQNYLMQPDPYC